MLAIMMEMDIQILDLSKRTRTSSLIGLYVIMFWNTSKMIALARIPKMSMIFNVKATSA
jgi:hypothetical protein